MLPVSLALFHVLCVVLSKHYLEDRERDPRSFDSAALHARKSLKSLYASLRIKPGDYAQKVLFDEKPPETADCLF